VPFSVMRSPSAARQVMTMLTIGHSYTDQCSLKLTKCHLVFPLKFRDSIVDIVVTTLIFLRAFSLWWLFNKHNVMCCNRYRSAALSFPYLFVYLLVSVHVVYDT
jgi:hypothetical protein